MHLLAIQDLGRSDLEKIFSNADKLLEQPNSQLLLGRRGILFFPESSIRTRTTFELGIKCSGGNSVTFPSTALEKKEELADVVSYLQNWADFVVIRHQDHNLLQKLAAMSKIPVINAMTSVGHPCEILSDLYSMRLRTQKYQTLTYTYVGPICNTLYSWCEAAELLGFTLNHVSTENNNLKLNRSNYRFSSSFENVFAETDVLLTDSLPKEYINSEYLSRYQISIDLVRKFKKPVIVNPCPPFYRGEEVTEDVITSSHFVGHDFKRTLLEVQLAVINHCMEVR